jgi:signal transduction histidine kinase
MRGLAWNPGPDGTGRYLRVRHLAVVTLGLAMLPLVLSVAARSGADPLRVSLPVLVAALFAVLAATERTADELRPLLATLALLTGGVVLIWVSGGSVGSHLALLGLVTVATLYHDWISFAVSLAFVWFIYGFIGVLMPTQLFAGMPENSPSGPIIAVVATVCATTGMCSWLIADRAVGRKTELEIALAAASQRQQQALEIHDSVVQGLATVVYALEAGEHASAAQNATETLERAKDIIGRLLTVDGADLSDLLNRRDPAQEQPRD